MPRHAESVKKHADNFQGRIKGKRSESIGFSKPDWFLKQAIYIQLARFKDDEIHKPASSVARSFKTLLYEAKIFTLKSYS